MIRIMIKSNQLKMRLLLSLVVLLFGVVLSYHSTSFAAPYNQIGNWFGAFLSVTMAWDLLNRVIIWPSEKKEELERIFNAIEAGWNTTVGASKWIGLKHIHRAMDFKKLFGLLQHGDELYFNDTYNIMQQNWLPDLQSAIEKGATAKFLVINPSSKNLAYRIAEINTPGQTLEAAQNDARLFQARLAEMQDRATKNNWPGKLLFCQYDELPGIPLYVIARDKIPIMAFSSEFLTETTQREFPHSEWNDGFKLKIYYKYITQRWERNYGKTQPATA